MRTRIVSGDAERPGRGICAAGSFAGKEAMGSRVGVPVLVDASPLRNGGCAVRLEGKVAIIVGAPFVGHLLAPFFTYLYAHLRPVPVVAGASTISRSLFVAGMLVATTEGVMA